MISSLLFSCEPPKQADILLYNGNINSVDESMTTYEAMAISDGRIISLGSDHDILSAYVSEKKIDLEGKHVYPGFIDPHSHFMGYSNNFLRADLTGSGSMEEVVDRLRDHASRVADEWIQGRGWDQNLWADRQLPGNELLNKAFPDRPVYIIRVDGHAVVANDKALDIANIDGSTQIDGGEIVTKNGKPTGLLIGRATNLVASKIPSPSKEETIRLIDEAQQNLFSVGLTSVSDAGLDKDEVMLIDSLQKSNDLKIRIYAMLNPTEENFNTFVKEGVYATDMLSIRSIKLFADGALGSRGALLLEPYSDDKENYGIRSEEPSYLKQVSKLAYDNGYQVNTHCIGDSAVRLMLNTYSKFLEPGNDHRWRIEHSQVVAPEDLALFGEYNIIPSVQTIHAVSDMEWAPDRLGDRIKHAYPFRSLLDQTGWLANGSDFPVEPTNPLYGFHAAFTRQDSEGNPPDGFIPEEAITREEALKAMTIWAAKANFEDHIKGSLEEGKVADFVILKDNLLEVPAEEIYDLSIEKTFLNGEMVYSK